MKKIFTLLFLAALSMGVIAQYTLPVNFEIDQEDTCWSVFANGAEDPANFVIIDNPDTESANTTAKCLKFTVLETADLWAGAWSDYYPDVVVTAEDYMMYMMVNKDVTSNCGLKLEQDQVGGLDAFEVKVPNTVTGEWELITFDMSAGIGGEWARLVFFPDFPDERTSGSVCHLDYIGFNSEVVSVREVSGAKIMLYPNPATDFLHVQYPGLESITISSITGQMVKSFVTDAQLSERVNISDLNPGVYFVTIDTADGLVSSKFVKN